MILNWKLNHDYKWRAFKRWFAGSIKTLEIQGTSIERFKLFNAYAWEQFQKGVIAHPQPGFLRKDKRIWVIILVKK